MQQEHLPQRDQPVAACLHGAAAKGRLDVPRIIVSERYQTLTLGPLIERWSQAIV
jgi:hypothetical protein